MLSTSFSSTEMRMAAIKAKSPAGGFGEGNDSPCLSCSCAREAIGSEMSHVRLMCPNVQHHEYYHHTGGLRLKFRKLLGIYLLGLGLTFIPIWCHRFPKLRDKYMMKIGLDPMIFKRKAGAEDDEADAEETGEEKSGEGASESMGWGAAPGSDSENSQGSGGGAGLGF